MPVTWSKCSDSSAKTWFSSLREAIAEPGSSCSATPFSLGSRGWSASAGALASSGPAPVGNLASPGPRPLVMLDMRFVCGLGAIGRSERAPRKPRCSQPKEWM
eukprot:699697-Prymnesium_polylepis.1